MLIDSIDRRGDERLVHHVLLRLHNAHDRSVQIVLAVAFDDALRLLGFLDLENDQ